MSSAAVTPGHLDWSVPPVAPDHRVRSGRAPPSPCDPHQGAGHDPWALATPGAGLPECHAESSFATPRLHAPPRAGHHVQWPGPPPRPSIAVPVRPPHPRVPGNAAVWQPHPPLLQYITLRQLLRGESLANRTGLRKLKIERLFHLV